MERAMKGKLFDVKFELITEDRDFTEGSIRAELELFEEANAIEIRNIEIKENTIEGSK